MANKQNFKPEEWTKILESTMLAGMAVSAAEPSGLWGALKEAFASSSALAAAKSNAGSNELIKAVVADFETKEGRTAVQGSAEAAPRGRHQTGRRRTRSLENLKQVSAILNAKAPQDAGGFKAWLQAISQNVAEASSEGGFLGIGGVQVSDAREGHTSRHIEGSRYGLSGCAALDKVLLRCWALPNAPNASSSGWR